MNPGVEIVKIDFMADFKQTKKIAPNEYMMFTGSFQFTVNQEMMQYMFSEEQIKDLCDNLKTFLLAVKAEREK